MPTDLTYTRAGNFKLNTDGYLVTQDGMYVVGRTAAGGGADTLIQIPAGATEVAIAQDGAVTYTPRGRPAAPGGRLPLAGDVRQRGRPDARLGQPLGRRPTPRAPRSSTPPA